MLLPTEEARTHGGLRGLLDANGGSLNPDGSYTIKANPLAVNSIEEAAKAAAAAEAAVHLPGGDTADARALAQQAEDTLRARQAVADLNETRFATERGELVRPNYNDLPGTPPRENWRLEDGDELDKFVEALNRNPVGVQENPESSGVGMYREPRGGFVCAKSKASCGDVGDDKAKYDSDEEYEKLDPSTREPSEYQAKFTEEVDPDVTDPTWDDFAEAWERMVQEHGAPTVEPAAEAVIPELSPTELSIYARVRVTDEAARQRALDSITDPVIKTQFDHATGFTGDLAESYRTGKVFVPTGASSASKLAEGWRFANEASLGVGVILWIKGVVETFQSDSTDLDKSTAALALVPGVGQILGIHDGLEHKDPAFVVSNVTALLSFALDLVGQPELALVLGVVSFVTAIVDTFLNMDPNDPRYQSYASWNIESRRDAAWKSEVAKGLLEKTIPALVTAANSAFDRAQHEILYAGDLMQASIDAGVANAGVADRNAGVAQKAKIRAATQQSLDALRTGFVSGSQGVEAAIRNAVSKLNGGDGFAEFTHGYLQQVERPDYVLAMYTGCRNGDSQTDDIPDEAQMLGCDARKPYYGDHFDSTVEPGIQAATSPGGLVAQTYVDAVDTEITKQGAFVELPVADTDPSLSTAAIAAPIASELSGVCLSDRGAGYQVTTVAIASCAANGWSVRPDHTITTAGGRCLDAAGQGTSAGTAITTWQCNGQANQRWTIHGDGTITGDQSGRCLDIRAGARDPGSQIELWDCNGQANQRWSYQAAPYAYSTIDSTMAGGRTLTAAADGSIVLTALGAPDGADQQWTFVSKDTSRQPWGLLRNAYDDTCLEASSQSTLRLAKCDPTNNAQQWQLQPTTTAFPDHANGGSLIVSFAYDDHCVNAPATPDQSGPAVLGTCSATNPQWRVTPNLTSTAGPHVQVSVSDPTQGSMGSAD